MRLIDADKYKGKIIASHCYSGVNKLINVDDVPTAYDVDKVVEQLEELKSQVPEELSQLMAYDEAIKIVKAGGNVNE